MPFLKSRCVVIFFVLLIFTPIIFTIVSYEINIVSNSSNNTNSPSRIELSQNKNENVAIESDIVNFIWIEGNLEVSFSSNISGYLKITFADTKGGAYFRTVKKIKELTDNEETNAVKITIRPQLTTFPGSYSLWLLISYFEQENKEDKAIQIYTEEFQLILGIGYIFLLSVGIIFGTAILLIIVKKESKEVDKKAPSVASSINLPEGKIKCPECSKIIDEGLSFCPECGNRIPDFLRFGSKPSSGL